jgi:ribosomal protein S13
MREGNVFNGYLYQRDDNLFNILKKSHGFDSFVLKKLIERLESKSNFLSSFRSNAMYSPTHRFLQRLLPKKGLINKRSTLNIYLLDLISSYRGWRHSRNLPVRGQRTWSNAWTSSKLNNFLKNIKIKKGRKIYGNLPTVEIYTAQLAEQVNLVWKEQWFAEWEAAKYARLSSKVHKNVFRIDLYSMAKGNVMSPFKFRKLSKKKQQSYNKNHFSLGFDPGFTRPLLRELYELRVAGKKTSKFSSVILHKTDALAKKRAKKRKKVDVKAKKAAHIAKKKTKKTAW